MHDAAKRAAGKIPGAKFVSLAGRSDISAFYAADDLLLPYSLELLHSAAPKACCVCWHAAATDDARGSLRRLD
jgi:hypothetical protein